VHNATLVGDPTQPGPYTIRVKVPSGVKVMPHKHPEDRVYTVISGVFYIRLGDRFDGEKLQAYPPGSVVVLPGNTHHFHWAKSGEYVSQVTAIDRLASNSSTLRTTCEISPNKTSLVAAKGRPDDACLWHKADIR
jgi:hypothetical protein